MKGKINFSELVRSLRSHAYAILFGIAFVCAMIVVSPKIYFQFKGLTSTLDIMWNAAYDLLIGIVAIILISIVTKLFTRFARYLDNN